MLLSRLIRRWRRRPATRAPIDLNESGVTPLGLIDDPFDGSTWVVGSLGQGRHLIVWPEVNERRP